MRSIIKEIGSNPQDLSRPPPNRKTNQGGKGKRGVPAREQGRRERASPIRGEEDARLTVVKLVVLVVAR